MSVLDKKLLLADIEERLNNYIPANTVRQIITDAGEALTRYEVTAKGPDDGGRDESLQLIKLFLDAKTIEGKAGSTIARYDYILTRLYEDNKVPLRKLTVYHLRQYMMSEKDRGISMNTIKGNADCWRSFFGWLRNEGLTDHDPTANLGTIKAKAETELPFSGEQIQLIREACKGDLERAIVHFLLSTGCRVSEMCAVNRSDVDYQNLRLTVKGKGDKERVVYIDNVTAMMLKRYLTTRMDIDPALFYSRNQCRITPNGVRAMLNRIGERSHVPNVHPHRFRHTLATSLVDRGMSVQEVSAILGHSKLDTTMTYVRVNQRNTENAYRRYACL